MRFPRDRDCDGVPHAPVGRRAPSAWRTINHAAPVCLAVRTVASRWLRSGSQLTVRRGRWPSDRSPGGRADGAIDVTTPRRATPAAQGGGLPALRACPDAKPACRLPVRGPRHSEPPASACRGPATALARNVAATQSGRACCSRVALVPGRAGARCGRDRVRAGRAPRARSSAATSVVPPRRARVCRAPGVWAADRPAEVPARSVRCTPCAPPIGRSSRPTPPRRALRCPRPGRPRARPRPSRYARRAPTSGAAGSARACALRVEDHPELPGRSSTHRHAGISSGDMTPAEGDQRERGRSSNRHQPRGRQRRVAALRARHARTSSEPASARTTRRSARISMRGRRARPARSRSGSRL